MNALASKGYASISIDFPFHGKRTYCATGGPVSVVNPSLRVRLRKSRSEHGGIQK